MLSILYFFYTYTLGGHGGVTLVGTHGPSVLVCWHTESTAFLGHASLSIILGHASLSIILGLASLSIIPRHASLSALAALLWLSPHAMGARDAQYGLVPSLLLAPLYGGSGGSGARLDSIDWMCLQQCFINSWAPELHSFTIPILLVAMEVSR